MTPLILELLGMGAGRRIYPSYEGVAVFFPNTQQRALRGEVQQRALRGTPEQSALRGELHQQRALRGTDGLVSE